MIHITRLFLTTNSSDSAAPATEGVAVSGTSTYYSKMWSGHESQAYAMHVVWSGTPTGTFTLWMSDISNPSETDDTDWVQDTSFVPTNPAGAAGKFRDDVYGAAARRKRLKYVNASGTGTIKAYVSVPSV